MRYRPALTAAKATVVLAVLPALLLVGEAGHAVPEPSAAPSADPGDPGERRGDVTLAPGPLPDVADTVTRSGPVTGLTVLTARESGLRAHAFGAGASRAAEGAGVGAMPATGEESQEWLVRTAAGGELVLQSLLLSSDDGGPLVLTTDPDDSVYLQHERPAGPAGDPGQLWSFEDGTAPAGPGGSARPGTGFRIIAHRGGCLLDNGYGERLTVGQCEDPRAWWTSGRPVGQAVRPVLPSAS
ncbi:hypothetical protein [Kitasatospora sp. NPDC088346]|uniref:hypothetical protein n=1 Tax=Kitasatospora sp. NPDC088346 TaxID=3364073 RepID=UPI0037F246D1